MKPTGIKARLGARLRPLLQGGQAADDADRQADAERLEGKHGVAGATDRRERLAPRTRPGSLCHAEQAADDVAGGKGHDEEDHGQAEHADRERQNARHDQDEKRIDALEVEGTALAIAAQLAQLVEDQQPAPADREQADHERRDLPDQNHRDHGEDGILLADLVQPVHPLGDHGDPDQDAGDHDRGQVLHARQLHEAHELRPDRAAP